MATVEEIETAREQAVRDLDLQVIEAIARRNASSSVPTRRQLDKEVINPMMQERTRLNAAAVKSQDASQEMKDALRTLHDATLILNRTAEHEKNLAEFLTVGAAFANAAAKLADALKSSKPATVAGG